MGRRFFRKIFVHLCLLFLLTMTHSFVNAQPLEKLRVAYTVIAPTQATIWTAKEMGFYAKHVVLQVIDSGSGVSEGIDVFKPFNTTKSQGTGIGLAIVREIVSLHGGSIAYTTEQGHGTTFRVKLPMADNLG